MTRSRNHRVGLFLYLSAILAAILAWEFVAGPVFMPESTPKTTRVNDSFEISSEAPPQKPPISTFSEFVERPLFAPSRRPPPSKTAADNPTTGPKAESFDLIGVVISADERMALLQTLGTDKVLRAVEGQTVGGWEVQAIKPTQVVLKRGNASEVIKINDAADSSQPSAKSTPPASGNIRSSAPAYTGIPE
jgi:hypothetical protein